MAAEQHTCYILSCDNCGEQFDNGDFIPHYDKPAQGFDDVRACEWTVLRDGRIHCDRSVCQIALPVCQCGKDAICDAEACPPGCACLLHDEVPPLHPCEGCGHVFENHAQRLWHEWKHAGIIKTVSHAGEASA